MLAWREHTCNTPKRGSQQTQLRTVEGLAFGPGVLTPNPQQASKQASKRERERAAVVSSPYYQHSQHHSSYVDSQSPATHGLRASTVRL